MRRTVIIALLSVLITTLWLVCYDTFLVLRYGAEQSISWQTYEAARNQPIIPLLVGLISGILFGHLFWPQR
jgi:hypothetical protein